MIIKLNESVITESCKQKDLLKFFFSLLLNIYYTPRPRILILATYLLCLCVKFGLDLLHHQAVVIQAP